MNYLYLLAKFIIGEGIIVGVTLLAQHVDPKKATPPPWYRSAGGTSNQ
jgi:hypothetical protein